MDVYEKGFYTILGCAALFAVIAIPLALRRIPRNVVYGYRTRTTLSDDTIWYEANAHFGRGLVIASLASVLAAWALELTRPLDPTIYLQVSIGILVVPALVATITTARFVRTLPRSPRGPGPGPGR